jgi:hypothetical protein
MRFEVLTGINMKMAVLRYVALCSTVDTDRRFRGAYCHDHPLKRLQLWFVNTQTKTHSVIVKRRIKCVNVCAFTDLSQENVSKTATGCCPTSSETSATIYQTTLCNIPHLT